MTPCGTVRIGSKIKIKTVFDQTAMMPSGKDEQAQKLVGKEGIVRQIGGRVLHGTWDSLGVLADKDEFVVLQF